MYLRFVWNRLHPRVAAEAGMFQAYWALLDRIEPTLFDQVRPWRQVPRDRMLRRRWLALRDAAAAFADMDAPEMRGPRRLRGAKAALFWFPARAALPKSQPGTVVLAARAMAWELARWDVEIREITTRSPGEILWCDPHQVLARPTEPVPRAFRSHQAVSLKSSRPISMRRISWVPAPIS
ncbi:MAG: hypothetical protein AAFU49_09795 [Pseudomonadota bacterium]